jgi:dTDP-4-amino-4,6-dideoxygalactose transaminase
VAERAFNTCISLPLFSSMTDDEVTQVTEAVRATVKESLR